MARIQYSQRMTEQSLTIEHFFPRIPYGAGSDGQHAPPLASIMETT